MRRIYSRSLPEPTPPPVPPPTTLTVDAYFVMRARDPEGWAAFNDWMESESVSRNTIYEVTFGEGRLHAKQHRLNGDGKRYIEDGAVAKEQRTYPLRTPPPRQVLPYLI